MKKITNFKQPNKVGLGLLPLPHDPRDLKHSHVFGGAPIVVPATDFDVRNGSKIKNQLSTDFCAGFSTCSINEDMQGRTFCPYFQFSKIKQVMGEYQAYGADLRSACKALTKFGSLPEEKSPYTADTQDTTKQAKNRDFLANWTNWPTSLDILAGEFTDETYFSVIEDDAEDNFDDIRQALWQHKDEHRGVEIGVMWRPEWYGASGGVIPEATYATPAGDGHAIHVVGQKMINGVPYLVVPNSWGENFGDHGVYYFPRSVINIEVKQFGAYMLSDMSPEKAKLYINYNLTTQDGAIAVIVKVLISLYNDFKLLLS